MTGEGDKRDELEHRRKLEQIQPLLIAARRELRLLQFDQAMRRCEQILQALPDSVEALEIKGDIHRARGEHEAALATFRRALELSPANRRIQDKHDLVLLDIDETRRLEARQKEAASNPEKFRRELKKPLWSCLLSCVLPGMGQIYNEEYAKGALLSGIFLLTLYLAFSDLWPVLQTFLKSLNLASTTGELQGLGVGRLTWALFNLLLCAGVWTYSVIDAPLVTHRDNQRVTAELGLDDEVRRLRKEVLGE